MAGSNDGYHWPTPQLDYLESMLYETTGNQVFSLAGQVDGCRSRTGTGNSSEAAEWIRLVSSNAYCHLAVLDLKQHARHIMTCQLITSAMELVALILLYIMNVSCTLGMLYICANLCDTSVSGRGL